jgi:hypothetical protein
MHIQKEAMDSDGSATRWLELKALVKDAQTFMHDLVHPQKSRIELTDDGIALFDAFKSGSKTHDEIRAAIVSNSKKYVSGAQFQL